MRRIDIDRFVRATRSTSRDINRRIILNLVRENEPVSRADLARRMGIGRGMVTSLVSELIEAGEIYSGSTVAAPRGRRPEMLFVRTRDRYVVAIDVRLTRTYLMLSDFGGRPTAMDSFETIVEPGDLASELGRRISSLLEKHDARGICEGIGLVVPGMVDKQTGAVLRAPQLGWSNVNIQGAVSEATGLPVYIENAPIACALARMWIDRGEDRAPQNFVYVTVSDGVGAAIVSRGEVMRGASDAAGEFGHVPIAEDGPQCMCGSSGCLEAHTSNLATIVRYLGEDFSPATARETVTSSGLTIEDIIERRAHGDDRADLSLHETARFLALGIAGIVNAVDPGVIFVGGEVTGVWDIFGPAIAKAIESRALTPHARATAVIPEAPGSHPRLHGATALVAARSFAAPVIG